MRLRVKTMLWGLMSLASALGTARYGLVTYTGIYGPQISVLSVGERVRSPTRRANRSASPPPMMRM